MKLVSRINNYLEDNKYKIIIQDGYVNITNYDSILDFTNKEVKVRQNNKDITISGNDLVISKMVYDEVLIFGNITNIRIN